MSRHRDYRKTRVKISLVSCTDVKSIPWYKFVHGAYRNPGRVERVERMSRLVKRRHNESMGFQLFYGVQHHYSSHETLHHYIFVGVFSEVQESKFGAGTQGTHTSHVSAAIRYDTKYFTGPTNQTPQALQRTTHKGGRLGRAAPLAWVSNVLVVCVLTIRAA